MQILRKCLVIISSTCLNIHLFCVAVKEEIALSHEKVKQATKQLDEAKRKLETEVM